MTKQKKALLIMQQLKKDYPVVETPLLHSNVFELLIATILSPQTNDETTNRATPLLFRQYSTPFDLASASVEDVDPIIRIVNYHKTKAQRIIDASQLLINEFDAKVPHKMVDLLKFPGVGRKVANVIISEWYAAPPLNPPSKGEDSPPLEVASVNRCIKSNIFSSIPRGSILPEGFVVDTHVLRVSKMLGLTEHTDPKKVEQDMMQLFPREEWNGMSLRFIFHGREINPARNPKYYEHPFWRSMYKNK